MSVAGQQLSTAPGALRHRGERGTPATHPCSLLYCSFLLFPPENEEKLFQEEKKKDTCKIYWPNTDLKKIKDSKNVFWSLLSKTKLYIQILHVMLHPSFQGSLRPIWHLIPCHGSTFGNCLCVLLKWKPNAFLQGLL